MYRRLGSSEVSHFPADLLEPVYVGQPVLGFRVLYAEEAAPAASLLRHGLQHRKTPILRAGDAEQGPLRRAELTIDPRHRSPRPVGANHPSVSV